VRCCANARVNDSLINVRVLDGARVMISGTVGSLAEKNLVEDLASIQGAQSVDVSHLEVRPWAKDEDLRRGKYVPKSDAVVRAALEKVLQYDPRVISGRSSPSWRTVSRTTRSK
jgi:hypothetical protein